MTSKRKKRELQSILDHRVEDEALRYPRSDLAKLVLWGVVVVAAISALFGVLGLAALLAILVAAGFFIIWIS